MNGAQVQLSDNFGPIDQAGSFVLPVTAGDVLGFYVSSTDGLFGPGEITFGALAPEPMSLTILGVGLAGLGAIRRRRMPRPVR